MAFAAARHVAAAVGRSAASGSGRPFRFSSSGIAAGFAQAEGPGRHGAVVLDCVSGAGAAALHAPHGAAALAAYLASRSAVWESAAAAAGGAAAWLRLPLRAPDGALRAAADAGFEYHHARGGEAMLLRWLGPLPSKVPPLATHQVGAGGAVLDSRGNLLVVRERARAAGGPPFAWKIPGGLSDAGEDLGAAAVREVFEETGVRAEFACVLAFRQAHGTAAFGVSDLYFVCLLRPLAGAGAGGAPLRPDAAEIDAAAWIDAAAFAAGTTHPVNAVIAREALAEAVRRGFCPDRPADAGGDVRGSAIAGVEHFSPVTRRWATVFLPQAAAARMPPSLEPGAELAPGRTVPPRPRPQPPPWAPKDGRA